MALMISWPTFPTTLFSAPRAIRTILSGYIHTSERRVGDLVPTLEPLIFSHIQKPLGMRKTRIGKRIYVHRVPLDTTRFCPYCCATVDTALVNLRATGSRTHTSARLTHLLFPWPTTASPGGPVDLVRCTSLVLACQRVEKLLNATLEP